MRRVLIPALGALVLILPFADTASAQPAGYRAGWGARPVGGWGVHRPGWRAAGLGWRTAGWRRPYAGYGWRYPWRPWAWGAAGVTAAYGYGYAYPAAYPYGGVYTTGYGYPSCGCGIGRYFYPAAAGWGW